MAKVKTKKEIAKILINKDIDSLSQDELLELILDESVAVDIDKECENTKTFSQKTADILTKCIGTWTFIIIFTFMIIYWIVLNSKFIGVDPFPFVLLNLILSCVAALQAPIIMMSQNRETDRERKRNQNDYKIDLKSELLLEVLYEHVEELNKNQRMILKEIKEYKEKNNK